MNKSLFSLLAALGLLVATAPAQDTNALRTALGVFEAQTGAVIIEGAGPVGSIATGTREISVLSKESTDAATGSKALGLAIVITGNSQLREKILVDDDELDSLINGINYLIKINYDVTPLPGFEAVYTTKMGLRIIAESVRKEGGVQFFLQYDVHPSISLTSLQMTQLGDLLQQARRTIDSLKATK
jgi:hypothetical protein